MAPSPPPSPLALDRSAPEPNRPLPTYLRRVTKMPPKAFTLAPGNFTAAGDAPVLLPAGARTGRGRRLCVQMMDTRICDRISLRRKRTTEGALDSGSTSLITLACANPAAPTS